MSFALDRIPLTWWWHLSIKFLAPEMVQTIKCNLVLGSCVQLILLELLSSLFEYVNMCGLWVNLCSTSTMWTRTRWIIGSGDGHVCFMEEHGNYCQVCVNLWFLCEFVMCDDIILYMSDDIYFWDVFVNYYGVEWYIYRIYKKWNCLFTTTKVLTVLNKHVLFMTARS
jgi:hypothetical protein